MKAQNKAYFLAGTAVLMWSTVGSAFKLTLRYLEPVQMLLYATAVSVLVFFIILAGQGKLNLLRKQRVADLSHSACLALLNPLLFYVVLFSAYDRLLTQEAMVLNFTWPVTLTILSVFILRQHISWKSMAAILISFSGILVIATQGIPWTFRFTDFTGTALALGSTVIWSLFWIYNIRDKRDEVLKLFLNFIFGFLYILALNLILGKIHVPKWQAVTGSIYIGIFEMGIAYVFWLKGLQLSATTAKVSNLIFFAPFISLVIINMAVGEQIHWATLIGLVLISAGVIMQKLTRDN
jgi:drug/metabolite transporter (DMT)-like permease